MPMVMTTTNEQVTMIRTVVAEEDAGDEDIGGATGAAAAAVGGADMDTVGDAGLISLKNSIRFLPSVYFFPRLQLIVPRSSFCLEKPPRLNFPRSNRGLACLRAELC